MNFMTLAGRLILLSAVVAWFSSCASTSGGTQISSDKVSQIKKGVTTRAEVEGLLGPPAHVGLMSDGRRMMTYSFYETSAHATGATYIPIVGAFAGGAKGQQRVQTLQIILTKEGVVQDYEFSDNTNRLESGGPFNPGVRSTPTGPSNKQ